MARTYDIGEDEGWLVEKNNDAIKQTELLCPCGGRIYQSTVLFKDGYTANRLYCSQCGLSLRSPSADEGGEWLKRFWRKIL